MPLHDFLALLGFASAMSFTPGPNTTLAAALGAHHGVARALPFCLAVPVGWTLMLLATTFGVAGLLHSMPPLAWALKAAGLAYLVWLAWKLLQPPAPGGAPAARLSIGFGQGVALQFLNIKAWMAALTVSAAWIAPAALRGETAQRLAVVLPTLMAFAFVSNGTYALLGASLRRWLAQGRRLQAFNAGMAVLLLATAAWMAAS
jgi:threonine/homoserine/homoserine lactone efflux protein